MNNRIHKLFQRAKRPLLSVFFTAGYPELHDTLRIAKLLEDSGADLIEIGIPFSDPLADGEVIQVSSERALQNGMTLDLLFRQLKDLRAAVKIPVLLMGYLNPVLQFGMQRFLKAAEAAGIDGIILPDLPPEVYESEYKESFEQYGLSNVFLITPRTPSERITYIDSLSSGFIYLVWSPGTTGKIATFQVSDNLRILSTPMRNPVLIGFGIADRESFQRACEFADGAIIGSAFLKAIASGTLEETVPQFLESIITQQSPYNKHEL